MAHDSEAKRGRGQVQRLFHAVVTEGQRNLQADPGTPNGAATDDRLPQPGNMIGEQQRLLFSTTAALVSAFRRGVISRARQQQV